MGNTAHGLYRQVVFIILRLHCFYFINEGLFNSGLYLEGGVYSEVAFNIGLTVQYFPNFSKTKIINLKLTLTSLKKTFLHFPINLSFFGTEILSTAGKHCEKKLYARVSNRA